MQVCLNYLTSVKEEKFDVADITFGSAIFLLSAEEVKICIETIFKTMFWGTQLKGENGIHQRTAADQVIL